MSMAKKRTLYFGKRGREQAKLSVSRVTVVQRLKTLGVRCLRRHRFGKKGFAGKNAPKASRSRP